MLPLDIRRERTRSHGRLPIGNGHAPGIEIGRDATGGALGVEVAVDGGTEFVTTSFSGGVLATAVGAAGFFAAIVFVGFLAALRAAGRRPAAFFLAIGLATRLAGRFATAFAARLAARFAGRRSDFLALDLTAFDRFRATVLRARDLLAERFATARLAAFFAADFFLAAIIHLQ
jgi:hypothetical protein